MPVPVKVVWVPDGEIRPIEPLLPLAVVYQTFSPRPTAIPPAESADTTGVTVPAVVMRPT